MLDCRSKCDPGADNMIANSPAAADLGTRGGKASGARKGGDGAFGTCDCEAAACLGSGGGDLFATAALGKRFGAATGGAAANPGGGAAAFGRGPGLHGSSPIVAFGGLSHAVAIVGGPGGAAEGELRKERKWRSCEGAYSL